MAGKADKHPVTNAIRHLRKCNVAFDVLAYKYIPRGGTKSSAEALGVEEHEMIKTLILETDAREPLIVLMHGDREVSTKAMARVLGVKSVQPCDPKVADRHSGYFVGGTSPFGTKRSMPVYAESTIFELEDIYINAGHRGLMLRMKASDLDKALDIKRVDAAMQ